MQDLVAIECDGCVRGEGEAYVNGDIQMCGLCAGLTLTYDVYDFWARVSRINELRQALQTQPYKSFNLMTPSAVLLELMIALEAEVLDLHGNYADPQRDCFARDIVGGVLDQVIGDLRLARDKEWAELKATRNTYISVPGQRLYLAWQAAHDCNTKYAEQQMLELDRDFPDQHALKNQIGWFYMSFRRDPLEALTWFSEAFEIQGRAEYSYRSGLCLMALGHYPEAMEFFQVSKNFPDYPEFASSTQPILEGLRLQSVTIAPA